MYKKNFEVYLDCGTSKIRAVAFNNDSPKNTFYEESDFFFEHLTIESKIQEIISSLENKINEHLDEVTLMLDSPNMLSIGISISKKIDGLKLKKTDIQFLVQDAKQQVLRTNLNQNISHIIIKNYKIDNTEYTFLPKDIKCDKVSLEIFFICLPKKVIEYYKKKFSTFNISVKQILCSSYAKSINYKENISSVENISFIDMGFNKTSIVCYYNGDLTFLDVQPIGGNHITKDISTVLNIDLKDAEYLKLNFDKNQNLLNEKKISLDLIQKIIFARIEEILELSEKSIKLNLKPKILDQYKMVLMGEGSKILNNKFKEKIFFSKDIDLLEENNVDICQSALKASEGSNKQEVVMIPKIQLKQGFFEKLFHFFK